MQNVTEEQLKQREIHLRTLLLNSLSGDAQTYQTFIMALTTHLRGYLWTRVTHHDPSEREDLLQEILLAVHKARHSYRTGEPLTAWVAGIARYKIADYFRAVARNDRVHRPWPDDAEYLSWEESDQTQAVHDVNVLLRQLPDRQRLLIIYVKLEGLSVIEASQQMGLSCSAVKVGIHRGIKSLMAIHKSTSQ